MYADLPLGINLIEDPSFESTVEYWSTSNAWLLGTASINLRHGNTDLYQQAPITGRSYAEVNNVASAGAGMGGVWYDLGILPAGKYLVSGWINNILDGTYELYMRAGINGVSVPPTIDSINNTVGWQQVSGSFTANGVDHYMLMIRNEGASYAWFLMDAFAVIPETSPVQLDLYQQMQPVADQDAQNGLALKRYLRAAALMFDQIEGYIRDQPDGSPGWSMLMNPLTAPAEGLDWLSQVAGTVIPFGVLTPEKRRIINEARGRERGTRNAIVNEVRAQLSNTKYIAFQERNPDDDHFGVGVLKSESPLSDWAGANLVSNPSFEVNTAGWATTGGGLTSGAFFTRDNFGAYHGDFTGLITSNGAGQGVWVDLGVLPAGTYHFFMQLRNYGASSNVTIDYGLAGSEITVTPVIPTTWQGVASTTPWTSDGVTASRIRIKPATFGLVWIDAVMVAASSAPLTAFNDGPTTTIIKDAVERERPVELLQNNPVFLDDEWTYFTIGSTIVAKEIGGNIEYQPVYPTYQSIKRHFTTYDDLKNNNPHDFENLIGNYYDSNVEKDDTLYLGFLTSGANVTVGSVLSLDTGTVYQDTQSGRFVTDGVSTNEGITLNLDSGLGIVAGETYTVNIFLRAITTAADVEVLAGATTGPTVIFDGTIPTGSWTQVQGTFVAGPASNQFAIRVPAAVARTINFDLYAVAPGSIIFPANF